VTFFVRKSLATGPIRFGVSPRKSLESIDREEGLSTGGSGEFIRKRGGGFFFADERTVANPSLPVVPSITRVPFLSSLKDGTPRGYGFVAMIIVGAILMLLGLAVVVRKGKAGYVEVVLGLILIVVPIVLTAQRRKQLREQEEKERAEREALEARNRRMLSSYMAALEHLRREPGEASFERIRAERQTLDLPYEIWSSAARRTVLQIGFEKLNDVGTAASGEIAGLMTRAAEAAGINAEDQRQTKLDLYRNVLWHLLADDRLGDSQSAELQALRVGLGISESDLPSDTKAAGEFRRLGGVEEKSLPRVDCGIALAYKEYCIHHARGSVMTQKRQKWIESGACDLYVTNRRVVLSAKSANDVPLPRVDDIDVDIDEDVLVIKTADPKKPIAVRVEDPIYTALVLDIATRIDERPKGFA
jgi:hypothetical protein